MGSSAALHAGDTGLDRVRLQLWQIKRAHALLAEEEGRDGFLSAATRLSDSAPSAGYAVAQAWSAVEITTPSGALQLGAMFKGDGTVKDDHVEGTTPCRSFV